MRRILITGSNRGIGLGLAQGYLQQEDTQIFATCRNPASADALNHLAAQYPGRLKLISLDVTDQASIDESVRLVSTQIDGLDMLINNAGILSSGPGVDRSPESSVFGVLQADAMLQVFRVNTVAPALVAQAYADLLRKGENARLVNISSDAGSLAMHEGGCDYSYPASKAALNMLTRCLSGDFRASGVVVVSIHPGWVQTDMGGPGAALPLEKAAHSIIKVIDSLTLDESGKYYNWEGAAMPW